MKRRARHLFIGLGITVAGFLLTIPLSGMFDTLERDALSVKYHVRGETPFDSSIVILYFDNDAIAALGGFPLKRHYYALAIDALHDLGAAIVGIDVAFTEADREHPEYDQALCSVVEKS